MTEPIHPRHRLDEVIHAPVRFSVMAYLSHLDRADFAEVRDAVEISDSTLSKQLTVLERAGYLEILKGHVGRRPRTRVRLTDAGRVAFRGHLDLLTRMAASTSSPSGSTTRI